MLEQLTSADFAPHLHEAFQLWLEPQGQQSSASGHGQALAIELVEVTDIGEEPPAGSSRRRSFSLIFRGPPAPVLPQRIYSLEHSALGRLDLFLVPIGPAEGGMQYQAIFT